MLLEKILDSLCRFVNKRMDMDCYYLSVEKHDFDVIKDGLENMEFTLIHKTVEEQDMVILDMWRSMQTICNYNGL